MKLIFQFFANFFAGMVGKLFIIANFVVCLFVFDWSKFIRYLEAPARIDCHIKQSGGAIDFSACGFYYYSPVDLILGLVGGLLALLCLPSIFMTELIVGDLKRLYPLWCAETFDIIYIPIFTIINSFYCLFLGDMLEKAHSAYLQNKEVEKPLSIFPE